ncbi:MAG: hypothetical protein LBR10_12280, partial [Prevotellaceae bacterium]|nr:hypothetical protein [Prevotellaceae bacterium]
CHYLLFVACNIPPTNDKITQSSGIQERALPFLNCACRHCDERSEEAIRNITLFYALFFWIASACASQ